MPEPRQVHALKFNLAADGSHYFICWPAVPDKPEHCARLINSKLTWMTARPGAAVNVRQTGTNDWRILRIQSVELFRVFPVVCNGQAVVSGQAWLDAGRLTSSR